MDKASIIGIGLRYEGVGFQALNWGGGGGGS